MNFAKSNFKEKLTETLQAVLPILAIVLLLCFSIAPIPPSILMTFLIGAFLLIIGMMLFNVAEKFMHMQLAAEKEIIYIVTKTELKNPIMKAIMEQAGANSKAKAITFSLPVTSTAGLRLIED